MNRHHSISSPNLAEVKRTTTADTEDKLTAALLAQEARGHVSGGRLGLWAGRGTGVSLKFW